MKKFISLPIVMLLALIASESSAFTKHFHDGDAHWYIMPKIGAAPSIFAHTGHQLAVVPGAILNTSNVPQVGQYANVLQEGPRLPKFSKMFHQGVLHVGVELGRSICERSECFLEFTYDRANGNCYGYCDPYVSLKAEAGCPSEDCNSSCSSSSSSCDDGCPTGDTLSYIASQKDNFGHYQSYGGFIGARHFTNRFWCDRFSFWYGYKVGALYRKAVDACSTFAIATTTPTTLPAFTRPVFCKSSSIAGGLQIGFDYCWSDNLSFQLGGEVVVASGLRGNRNFAYDVSALYIPTGQLPLNTPLVTNGIMTNTGAVINFPVWFGMTWEFGGCFSSCK